MLSLESQRSERRAEIHLVKEGDCLKGFKESKAFEYRGKVKNREKKGRSYFLIAPGKTKIRQKPQQKKRCIQGINCKRGDSVAVVRRGTFLTVG